MPAYEGGNSMGLGKFGTDICILCAPWRVTFFLFRWRWAFCALVPLFLLRVFRSTQSKSFVYIISTSNPAHLDMHKQTIRLGLPYIQDRFAAGLEALAEMKHVSAKPQPRVAPSASNGPCTSVPVRSMYGVPGTWARIHAHGLTFVSPRSIVCLARQTPCTYLSPVQRYKEWRAMSYSIDPLFSFFFFKRIPGQRY